MRRLLVTATVLLALCASTPGAELKDISAPEQIRGSVPNGPKLRVVNLWATWCAPCVKEIKDLVAIDQEFDDSEVQIVGVSVDDMVEGTRNELKARVRKFITSNGVHYQNLYYTGGFVPLQTYFDFIGEIPLTVVYDAKWKRLAHHQGPVKKSEFSRELRKLLKKEEANR